MAIQPLLGPLPQYRPCFVRRLPATPTTVIPPSLHLCPPSRPNYPVSGVDPSSQWRYVDVPISALDVVTLSSDQCCKTTDCSLFVALHNLGKCILHSQTWFPREFDRFGKPAANRRGYGLYGPHFFAELHRKGCGVLLLLILALRKTQL